MNQMTIFGKIFLFLFFSYKNIYLVLVLLLIVIQWIDASRIIDTRTIMEKQGRDVILSCRFEQLHEEDRVMW
jgi:hypothetical protein